jgi:hypothetical protein
VAPAPFPESPVSGGQMSCGRSRGGLPTGQHVASPHSGMRHLTRLAPLLQEGKGTATVVEALSSLPAFAAPTGNYSGAVCYHFATQLLGTRQKKTGRRGATRSESSMTCTRYMPTSAAVSQVPSARLVYVGLIGFNAFLTSWNGPHGQKKTPSRSRGCKQETPPTSAGWRGR